ncbi:hypothetical protein B0H66DRAFT_547355 [Apodospora peruviana]|uniref:Uncharacterized protein n=1 Tax=Apodospora peruviana TaxID=516989 RepID=A0AAE0IH49_9PEZI|nr:hypothetical protein B0H66DRAFT_547355 [Apodospora peruviana]
MFLQKQRPLTTILRVFSLQHNNMTTTTTNFLSLPGELRNRIYASALVIPNAIILLTRSTASRSSRNNRSSSHNNKGPPWVKLHANFTVNYHLTKLPEFRCRANFPDFLPVLLFVANKQFHDEASSIFYGSNRFMLDERQDEVLSLFLSKIGPRNASLLGSLSINFPGVCFVHESRSAEQDVNFATSVCFKREKMGVVEMIGKFCKTLESLELRVAPCVAMDSMLIWPDGTVEPDQLGLEVMKAADECLREMLGTTNVDVVVYLYDPPVNQHVLDEMERLGWRTRYTSLVSRFTDLGRAGLHGVNTISRSRLGG